VSEFDADVPEVIASEGLAQSPYVVTRAGFKPTTLQMKGIESTNEPPHPTYAGAKKMKSLAFQAHGCLSSIAQETALHFYARQYMGVFIVLYFHFIDSKHC